MAAAASHYVMFHVDRERTPRGQSQLPEKRRERKPEGRLGLVLPWSFLSWNGCCPASHFQILCNTQARLLPVNILLTLSGVEFLLLSVEIILPNTAQILPVLCQPLEFVLAVLIVWNAL